MTKFVLEGVRPLYERSSRDKTVVGIFYYFGIFDDLVLERTKDRGKLSAWPRKKFLYAEIYSDSLRRS